MLRRNDFRNWSDYARDKHTCAREDDARKWLVFQLDETTWLLFRMEISPKIMFEPYKIHTKASQHCLHYIFVRLRILFLTLSCRSFHSKCHPSSQRF